MVILWAGFINWENVLMGDGSIGRWLFWEMDLWYIVLLGYGSLWIWFYWEMVLWEMVLFLGKWFYLLGYILGDYISIHCKIILMEDVSLYGSLGDCSMIDCSMVLLFYGSTESSRIF